MVEPYLSVVDPRVVNRLAPVLRRIHEACALLVSHAEEIGLKKLVLFGSVARGTFSSHSDIDLLVLVETSKNLFCLQGDLDDLVNTDALLEGKIACDVILVSMSSWNDPGSNILFKKNIAREGIQVWP